VLLREEAARAGPRASVAAAGSTDGIKLVAAPLPLKSFRDEVAALNRMLERVRQTIVLLGHAYARVVIAATRDRKVKGLVYVAALAPGEGRHPT
jgi:hypothetical protein